MFKKWVDNRPLFLEIFHLQIFDYIHILVSLVFVCQLYCIPLIFLGCSLENFTIIVEKCSTSLYYSDS